MKIRNTDSKPIGPLTERGVAGGSADAKARGAAPAGAEPSATVELSAAASALGAAGADFDGAKVERIAQAIRDGRYQIDAEAIADKLIANAKELLGRTPH